MAHILIPVILSRNLRRRFCLFPRIAPVRFLNSAAVFFLTCSSIFAAPLIVTQPASLSTNVGSPATFSVSATGVGNLTYQWTFNGKTISGATTTAYTVTNSVVTNVGAYRVVVSDLTGTSTSLLAIVTIKTTIPSTIFNITNYGAIAGTNANGTPIDNATAIQNAINAANIAGGGVVEVPAAAQPYISGRLTLFSKIKLQVDVGATLEPLPYGTFPVGGDGRYDNWLTASHAHDIEICGGGTIDGNGQAWWDAFNANNNIPHRPYLIDLGNCLTVYLHDITLHKSPMFHFVPDTCTNVTIDDATITSSGVNPINTDAIDPSGVNILIENSTIAVNDDNVAVKAGGTFCHNIVITHCTMGTGHGISVGGQSNAGLDDMLVAHCSMTGTTSGFRLKADASQGGFVRNIYYTDVQMTNVQYPIVFYSYYREIGNPGDTPTTTAATYNATPPDPLPGALATWKNITLDNVSAIGATGGSIIWGIPLNNANPTNAFFSGVRLNNVSINNGSGSSSILHLYNVYDVQLTGTNKIATYTTYNALAIKSEPQDVKAGVGGIAGFVVAVVGTSGVATVSDPTYRWYREGIALNDGTQGDGTVVAGSTTPGLSLSSVTPAANGHYTVIVSNSLDSWSTNLNTLVAKSAPFLTTSLPASLVVTQSFASWTLTNGLSGPDTAATADPDADGIVNFFEYALGLSPTSPDAHGLPNLVKQNGQYVFRFVEPAIAADASYTVQSSSNLVDWTTVTPVVESITLTNQTVKATFSPGLPALFVRLLVTGP